MPQLDIFSFTPVISWLIVIIFTFYNVSLVTGLSRLYKILGYRIKNLENYKQEKEKLEKEGYYVDLRDGKTLENEGNIQSEREVEMEKEVVSKITIEKKTREMRSNYLVTLSIGVEK
jgi:hypothetical protein